MPKKNVVVISPDKVDIFKPLPKFNLYASLKNGTVLVKDMDPSGNLAMDSREEVFKVEDLIPEFVQALR